MITPDEIRQIMAAKGWKQRQLADATGVQQPTVSRWLSPDAPHTPDPEPLLKLIALRDETKGAVKPANFRPPPELVSFSDTIPLHAAAEGGEGFEIISSEPFDYVPRPYTLRAVREAYAILIESTSMVPAFEPGDKAWVNPALGPRRGKNFIFYATQDGVERAMIKRLVNWTDSEWTVQQWNPEKTFKLDRGEWDKVHRVIGHFEEP